MKLTDTLWDYITCSENCKSQWLSQLGFQPTCFSSSSSSVSPVIDVYLDSYFHYSHYSMLPGWLGSVSCDSHTIYSQILLVILSTTVLHIYYYNVHVLISYTEYIVLTYLCCLYIL